MAEPQTLDLSDRLDWFLKCPICKKDFDDTSRRPRLLKTCLHAICTDCLDDVIQKEGKAQITCPFCRQVDKVEGKADSLLVDPLRSKLVDYVKIKQKTFTCTECEQNEAVSRCQKCKCFLCKECDFVHRRHRATRGHTISSLKDVMDQPWKCLSKGHFCLIHPQHQLDFFCAADAKLCCLSCTVEAHKGHNFQKVKDFATAMKKELKVDIRNLQRLTQSLKNANLEAEKQQKTITDTTTQSLEDIYSMFDELQKAMDRRKQHLVDKVNLKSSSISADIKTQVQANENTMASAESTESYFKLAEQKADDVEILQIHPSIKRAIGTLRTQMEASNFHESFSELRFQKEKANDVAQMIPLLGDFEDEETRRGRSIIRPGFVRYPRGRRGGGPVNRGFSSPDSSGSSSPPHVMFRRTQCSAQEFDEGHSPDYRRARKNGHRKSSSQPHVMFRRTQCSAQNIAEGHSPDYRRARKKKDRENASIKR